MPDLTKSGQAAFAGRFSGNLEFHPALGEREQGAPDALLERIRRPSARIPGTFRGRSVDSQQIRFPRSQGKLRSRR
jgi:hypothetical protein